MSRITDDRIADIKTEIKKLNVFGDSFYAAVCFYDQECIVVDVAHEYGDAIDRFISFFDKFPDHPIQAGYPSSKPRKNKWEWIKRHHSAAIIPVKVSLGT